MELKKHIAVLCDYWLMPNRIGGMDFFFWQFDAACKKQDIVVDWFFPNVGVHGEYPKLNIISEEGKSIETLFIEYAQKNPVYSHVITHFFEICTHFFKAIKQNIPAKIIAVDHNSRPLEGYPLKKKVIKGIKGILYSKYIDVFVGVSQYTVNELIRDFGERIKTKCLVIHNGILLENIKIREVRNFINPSFLVVSGLRQSKGIQDLIVAVSQLPDEFKNKLIIDVYGEGPLEEYLLQRVKDFEVTNNFNFKGNSPTLSKTYCNYDYLLQPTYMECFSLTLLESLAANVPVITTPVGGNIEVVTNNKNGYIFPAKNVGELKENIEELLKGTKSITENTRPFIEENFGLNRMVEKYINLLK